MHPAGRRQASDPPAGRLTALWLRPRIVTG